MPEARGVGTVRIDPFSSRTIREPLRARCRARAAFALPLGTGIVDSDGAVLSPTPIGPTVDERRRVTGGGGSKPLLVALLIAQYLCRGTNIKQ
jgi:hypothetical protein